MTRSCLLCISGLLLMLAGVCPTAHADGNALEMATFDAEVSPPIGSPLAYDPTEAIEDPLRARGIILRGAGDPIVLCAVDWIGIGNAAHDAWRHALAEAAGTTAERVTVHALHQHDAPISDFTADALLAEHGLEGVRFDRAFAEQAIEATADSARDARQRMRTVTHIGTATAVVDRVASNRRLLNRDGQVRLMRWSASQDPEARAAPVGRIDPELKLLALYEGDEPLAVLTWYAVHPQSYYRTGRANPDFPGLARAAREQATGTKHVHFTGAAGNIAAGKWNDGSREMRQILADRLADAMAEAWDSIDRTAVTADDVEWRTRGVALPPAEHLDADALEQTLADETAGEGERVRAARELAWLRRCLAGHEIELAALRLGPARVLHAPGELLVEYQLDAQARWPDDFIATAAYGDYAPGYIGTESGYHQGGYEPSQRASRVSPQVEHVLRPAIREVLNFDAFAADPKRIETLGYRLERFAVQRGFDGETSWVHARAGVIPEHAANNSTGRPTVVLTTQPLELTGSDVFHGIHTFRSHDLGLTWEGPFEEPAFERETVDAERSRDRVVSDFTPKFHEATHTMLGTGHTVLYEDNRVMPVRPRHTAYATYDPQTRRWSPWRKLELPDEPRFANAGAGSVQRVDLEDGTILLPIYFKEPEAPRFHVTVVRCTFDGETLRYVEHGDELTIDIGRGLYEPSLTEFDGRYYLTMRNDEDAYVAVSDDGLSFTEPRPWTFDDGRSLGSYNTQQHWVTHSDALYLAYTRRGADNDHVFRHRAPLFLARVDPERLHVVEATEQAIVPERGARLGNFGVVDVNEHESWVIAAEWMQPEGAEAYGSDNTIHVARLKWHRPNQRRVDQN